MIPSETDRDHKIEMEPEFDVIHHGLTELPFGSSVAKTITIFLCAQHRQ